jgi:hypothetical protein
MTQVSTVVLGLLFACMHLLMPQIFFYAANLFKIDLHQQCMQAYHIHFQWYAYLFFSILDPIIGYCIVFYWNYASNIHHYYLIPVHFSRTQNRYKFQNISWKASLSDVCAAREISLKEFLTSNSVVLIIRKHRLLARKSYRFWWSIIFFHYRSLFIYISTS